MKKTIILIILIISLLFLIYFFGIIKPKCTTDSCFNENLKSCTPCYYIRVQNNNIYKYTISRSFGNNCKLTIRNIRVAVGTDLDTKTLIEGKSMKCKVPKTKLKEIELDNMKDLLNYCTGPLKEGIYELLLKKIYSLIVAQMSDIVKEAEKVLKTI